MVAELVRDYSTLCMHVTDLIDLSGYKVDFVRQKLGYSKPGFYKKRKAGNFTPEEIMELLKVIRFEEIEDKIYVDLLEDSRKSGMLTEKETKSLFASL
jgi:hypothetical protein